MSKKKKTEYSAKEFFEQPHKVKEAVEERLKQLNSANTEDILKTVEDIKAMILTDKLIEVQGTQDAIKSDQVISPSEALYLVYTRAIEVVDKFILSNESKDIKNVIASMGVILDTIKVQAALAKDYIATKDASATEQILLEALKEVSPETQKKVIGKMKDLRDSYLKRGLLGSGPSGENIG